MWRLLVWGGQGGALEENIHNIYLNFMNMIYLFYRHDGDDVLQTLSRFSSDPETLSLRHPVRLRIVVVDVLRPSHLLDDMRGPCSWPDVLEAPHVLVGEGGGGQGSEVGHS